MHSRLLLTTSILAIPAALFAADFWQQKPTAEWSEKDCSKLVAHSPWAKDTVVVMGGGMPAMGGGGGGRGRGGGGGGGMGGGGDMGGGGGMAGAAGGGMGGGGGAGRSGSAGEGGATQQVPEAPHVVVRWESSTPVREAMKRVSVTKAVDDADVLAFYIVSVDGLRIGGRRRDPDGNEGAGPVGGSGRHDLSTQMQDRLKASTSLTAKGKEALNPGKVDVVPGDDGKMTFRFYFPRSADLSLDDKEVTFLTRVGPTEVKQKFVLKEMTFGGKLAL